MKEGPERWKRILDPRCFRSGLLGSDQGATLPTDPRDRRLDIPIDFKSSNVKSSAKRINQKYVLCICTKHTRIRNTRKSSKKMIIDKFLRYIANSALTKRFYIQVIIYMPEKNPSILILNIQICRLNDTTNLTTFQSKLYTNT